MKTIKYVLLLLVMAGSFTSCVVREHRGPRPPMHHDGDDHWDHDHH